jgi:hypothetical protein
VLWLLEVAHNKQDEAKKPEKSGKNIVIILLSTKSSSQSSGETE